MPTTSQILTNPLLTEETLFTWTFRRWVSFLTTRPLLQVDGSHVLKFLNLNVSGTNKDVAPKQRFDRFSSVEDHIHTTPTFEHVWATPGHTVVIGGC